MRKNQLNHTPIPLRPSEWQSLGHSFYKTVSPEPLHQPYWIATNQDLAAQMHLPSDLFSQDSVLAYLSGSASHCHPAPLATVYSGHQFGTYVRQLGDGRALNLGTTIDTQGTRQEWQLKGAGKTPFSRFADGRAVLRSSIREYLASEAMHYLGIPTTRALALTGSHDPVYREEPETAAIVTRIAPSFLRFGHFEYFYHSGRHTELQTLIEHTINTHYPECRTAEQPYLALLNAIIHRSAELVAAWQSVGFAHGVLNTDNMSLLGLTIDYGPYGFLDAYDKHHTPNHSDTGSRYTFNEQPYVVHWNLSRLASCLLPWVAEADLINALDQFPDLFQTAYHNRMRAKLGLQTPHKDDAELIADLMQALQSRQVDFTLFFRRLALIDNVHETPIPDNILELFHGPTTAFKAWVGRYRGRLRAEQSHHADRITRMNAVNPLYILRNYLLENAIAEAKQGRFDEIANLQLCMRTPFTEQPQFAHYAQQPPAWASSICISCSS